jgi:transglutaminase-like putative cysteine protease
VGDVVTGALGRRGVGSEARARLALGGVLAITLLAFGQLFAGDDYVGPALLGAMAAVGISMLGRRLGAGPWLTLSISFVALAWYLCIVFESDELLYGLPTLRAAAGIFNSLTRAANASSADFAPVPLRPGYVAMTVAGLWTCAAIGEIATFRWRRPLLASLGPIALVSFLLIVAQGSLGAALVVVFIVALLTYWALESTHRLRSWGRWVGAWTNREGDPDAVTGRVARRMGLGAVAAAIMAPTIVPAFGSGVLTWRTSVEGGPSNGAAGGSGAGGGGAINPFVELQPRLLEQTEAELFTVRAEAPSYWRLVSLSDFDGETWTQGDSDDVALEDGVVAGPQEAESVTELEQTFELTGLEGPFAPAAERPTEVTEGADELEADVETQHLTAISGDVSGLSYSVRSARPDLAFDELSSAEVGDLGERQDDYIELPSDLDPRILDLAERWIEEAEATSDFERLVALQDRFQDSGEFVYSDRVAPPEDDDGYLYRFLTESREGYCQQYATAFAVMARLLGYPTRVSVGFLPGSGDADEADLFTVRGTHAHAWPEVYFEDHGWVTFEPTPRAISQPPAHTREPQAGGGTASGEINPFSDPDLVGGAGRLDGRSGPRVGEGDAACPPGLTQAECQANIADPGSGAAGRSLTDEFAWQQRFAVIWRAALVLLALFLVLVPLLKEARTKRRYRRASSPSATTAAAFFQFLDDSSELTLERAPAESAIAYASRLGSRQMVNPLHAGRLAQLFERAEYSAMGTHAGQAAEARRLARTLRRSMWRQASMWMRLRRLFSPTGLVAGLRRDPRPRFRSRQAA